MKQQSNIEHADAAHGSGASPKVVVILLNYNRASDTIECIHSLRRGGDRSLEIIVVNNGSTDDSTERLEQVSDCFELRETGKNLGFTGGVNFGIRYAREKNPAYILLLNNDVVVEPDCVELLVAAMESNPDAGAAGGTICYFPATEKVWYAGGEIAFWRGTAVSELYGDSIDKIPKTECRQVGFVSGCLMMIRTSTIDLVGALDDRYFMYYEDAEYSSRIRRSQLTLLYVPLAKIYHKIRHEEDTPFSLYYGVRNRFLFITDVLSGWKRVIAYVYVFLTLVLKMGIWFVRKPALSKAAVWGIQDFVSRRLYAGRGLLIAVSSRLSVR